LDSTRQLQLLRESARHVPQLIPGQKEAWRALGPAHVSGEIMLGDDLAKVARDLPGC
jgi:hypothetical protein